MKKYLVIFNLINSDDIEFNGFMVMTEKEVNNYEELVETIYDEFSIDLEFTKITFSSGDDLLSMIDFKEISNEQYKALEKLFENGFGVVVNESTIKGLVDEESEEDETDLDDDFENEEDLDDDY